MGKEKREWHSNFLAYMNFIANHPNYKDLPIERKSNGELSWIATAQSETGKKRIAWALKKARELNIPTGPGVYARVMISVHPTKRKTCQVCGNDLDLHYVYPNQHLINALKKSFDHQYTTITHIKDVINDLLDNNVSEDVIKRFLIGKMSIDAKANLDINEIVSICEKQCRNGHSNMLGPGAMSNFPDRYDGFHTYNRCCRASKDTGRSKENMKTYTKDRRAYEYWSDGNIHAANKFMGNSTYFKKTSADHIGPISLGFIHDSYYLRPMSKGSNSSKRDRLLYEDIKEIISVEKKSEIPAMSRHSRKLWEFIKANYEKNQQCIETYRQALKTNMANFMLILWTIKTKCRDQGKKFLIRTILIPKMTYFAYDYIFNALGEIVNRTKRNITDSTRKEFERFVRIAFKAVDEYHDKENRNVKTSLDSDDEIALKSLCKDITDGKDDMLNFRKLSALISSIQDKLITKL